MLRSISESMLRAAWDFDEISGSSGDPVSVSVLLAEHLNVSGKNIEDLDCLMAMYGHRTAGRNCSFYNARSLIASLRCNQKLNTRSEHIECLAIRFYYEMSRWSGFA